MGLHHGAVLQLDCTSPRGVPHYVTGLIPVPFPVPADRDSERGQVLAALMLPVVRPAVPAGRVGVLAPREQASFPRARECGQFPASGHLQGVAAAKAPRRGAPAASVKNAYIKEMDSTQRADLHALANMPGMS